LFLLLILRIGGVCFAGAMMLREEPMPDSLPHDISPNAVALKTVEFLHKCCTADGRAADKDAHYAAKYFQNGQVNRDLRLVDLEMSSIEILTAIYELEDFYGLDIVDANLDNFESIGEAADLIVEMLELKHKAAEAS
jgi:acyl carrier protein